MEQLSEHKLRLLVMEILRMERSNLKTKKKDDGKMAEVIMKTVSSFTDQRF